MFEWRKQEILLEKSMPKESSKQKKPIFGKPKNDGQRTMSDYLDPKIRGDTIMKSISFQ